MKKTIRVGIIGQGRSGRNIHAVTMRTLPRKYKVVAVSDPMPERRARAESEYGCKAYAGHKGLLKRDDLDVIVNASPSQLHPRLSLECLEAGFNVLCEKPLARKVVEVDRIMRAAKKAGTMIAVFQNNRYAAHFRQVKKVVDSGVLGRIVLIKAAANAFSRRWDWQTLRKNYGGSLLNTGPHGLDQLIQFFGVDVMPKITCVMDRANTYGDAEDHVKVLMTGKGKPTIDFEISSCCAYPQPAYIVYGTRGGLQASAEKVEWKYFNPREQVKQALTEAPISGANGLPVYCGETIKWHEKVWQKPKSGKTPMALFYEMLYKTLAQGEHLEVTMQEVRRQIQIIEECHRQNPPGRMPVAER